MCRKGHHHYPGRGFIETLILWIIHKRPLHGYGVRKKIEEMTSHYTPKPGAIYTILRRMEKKGLLTSQWNERTGKRDRRIYHVTEKGESLLKTRLKIMKERIGLLEQMVSFYNSNFAEEQV